MGFVKLAILVISIICSLTAGLSAQANQPINNPALTSPALRSPLTGPGTVPVTTYQSGLRQSLSPIDNSADLIMSGHAAGGKHFRGVLPYNSDSAFGISSPTQSIDSFLRYTSVSDDYYRGGITPYYSYTSTVTRMAPGNNTVIVPPSSKIRGIGLDSATELQTSRYRQDYNVDSGVTSLGQERLEYTGLTRGLEYPEKQPLPKQDYQKELEEFNQELRQVSEKVDNLQKQFNVESQLIDLKRPVPEVWQSGSQQYHSNDELEIGQDDLPQDSQSQKSTMPQNADVYTQMMREYQDLNEAYEEVFGQTIEEMSSGNQESGRQSELIEERRLNYQTSTRITEKPSSQKPVSEDSSIQGELLESEARKILSEHKTFASFADDRFNQSIRAAETYMKEGKFYLAADAYTMASIYKPQDPLAYAGKSHALFAAGEYISSALYLAKAIEMFPGYVEFRVDVVSMIGDIDTVEKRITDISQWLKSSGAPELNFLLAYINMQLGRLEKANEAITAANERMPDLAAVKILQQAIEKRLGK